jgi:hypothetical protein
MIQRAQSWIQDALEHTRLWGTGLMPLDALTLKHLGTLFPIVPISLGVLFLLSWKLTAVNSAQAAAITSTLLALMFAGYTLLCLIVMTIHF